MISRSSPAFKNRSAALLRLSGQRHHAGGGAPVQRKPFSVLRARRAELVSGALRGSRQNGSLGYHFMVEPGGFETVIANTANRALPLDRAAVHAADYYFWLPAPAAIERRCSPVASANIEGWQRRPMPRAGDVGTRVTEELALGLGL